MQKIKEKLMEELCDVEEKIKKAGGGKMSAGDLEYIHKLTDSIKNIDKIEMMEDGEYSEAMGDMEFGGSSYARGGRGRGRNARRDSMGRYSREGGEYSEDGMSYRGGSSYARGGMGGQGGMRGGRGGYSRGDAKEHMIGKMEEMMDMAESPREREAIRQCIEKIENA